MAVTHTILKGAALVLHTEQAEGAPDGIYLAECMVCPETSGRMDSDPNRVARWAILHTKQHGLTHGQFVMTTERHWRVDPLRAPDSRSSENESERTPHLATIDLAPQARTRVQQRARRRQTASSHAAAHAGDWSGTFTVLALVTVCTLGGYLIGLAHGTG